tara:strand:- start:14898 stop:16340 length:1443 start_codon:yes stop_codon:yes gene_type:complete
MRKSLFIILVFIITSSTKSFSETFNYQENGYNIIGEIKNMADTSVILAYYFGGKQYATDTTKVVNGKLSFRGNKELKGGIYLIVLPDGKYFELIISEKNFSFITDKNNLVSSMRFIGSKENSAFYEYLKYISGKQKQVVPLQEKLKLAKSENEKSNINSSIKKIDNDVREYRKMFVRKYPNVFFSKIIKATTDIEIPERNNKLTSSSDEDYRFYYYKNNFWNNMDFSDNRMLRTPVFFNKMDQYLEKLTPKHPDSVILSSDIIVNKARSNKEVFQYVVSYITSTYERSKIMGMDAVFVHMVEKYYMNGECDWIEKKQLDKIIERANRISPNMIGKKPPNLVFKDPDNKYHSLYHVDAKYTLLFFYDPDCGHCKEEAPKVRDVCDSLVNRGVDIKVYAVTTEFDIDKWKEFIQKMKTNNWINVGDIQFDNEGNPVATSNWREEYDLHSTPVVYLLDKDKKIIAKRISEKQIAKIIKQDSKK